MAQLVAVAAIIAYYAVPGWLLAGEVGLGVGGALAALMLWIGRPAL